MAEGKINIFNLGEKGVVVSKDPIHVADGELTQAQNAVTNNPDEGLGGLEKRGGMAKVNTGAMTGSVQSLTNVPLPDPVSGFGEWIYAPHKSSGVQYLCSSASYDFWVSNGPGLLSGSDNAPGVSGVGAGVRQYDSKLAAAFPAGITGNYRVTSMGRHNNKLYYAADVYVQDTDAPPIRCFTGTKDFEFARIPEWFDGVTRRHAKAIVRIITFDGFLYVTTWDGGAGANLQGRVFRLDPETGTLLQIGNAFGNQAGEAAGGMPFSICGWQGRLWVGTANGEAAPAGNVYWIRPGIDTSWTLDHTATAGQGNILALAGFSVTGNLYAGTDGVGGVAGLVKQRTPSGVWSNSDVGIATGARNRYDILIEFENRLYAHWWEPDNTAPAANQWVIRQYDGAAWSTGADIVTILTAAAMAPSETQSGGSALALPDLLIVCFGNSPATVGGNAVHRKTGVWSWSQVAAFGGGDVPLGYIRSDDALNTFHP